MSTKLTFDDVEVGQSGASPVPQGYHGFDWSGFAIYDRATYQPAKGEEGFRHGATSGTQALFTTQSGDAPFEASIASEDGRFTLKSAEVTPATFKMLHFDVYGYQGKHLIYTEHFNIKSTAPVQLTFDMAHIDKVVFSEAAGEPKFIMDDMIFGGKASTPAGRSETVLTDHSHLTGLVGTEHAGAIHIVHPIA